MTEADSLGFDHNLKTVVVFLRNTETMLVDGGIEKKLQQSASETDKWVSWDHHHFTVVAGRDPLWTYYGKCGLFL